MIVNISVLWGVQKGGIGGPLLVPFLNRAYSSGEERTLRHCSSFHPGLIPPWDSLSLEWNKCDFSKRPSKEFHPPQESFRAGGFFPLSFCSLVKRQRWLVSVCWGGWRSAEVDWKGKAAKKGRYWVGAMPAPGLVYPSPSLSLNP